MNKKNIGGFEKVIIVGSTSESYLLLFFYVRMENSDVIEK